MIDWFAEPIPEIVLNDPEGRKSVVEMEPSPLKPPTFWNKFRPLLCPTFVLDVLSFSIIFQGLITFMLLAVDYVKDKGIDQSLAMHTFPAFCVGDLLTRSTAGIFIDAKIISTALLMAMGSYSL